MEKSFVTLVIPVYNEEKLIHDNIKVIRDYIDKTGVSYEILLVDDGSSDKTWYMIHKLAKIQRNIRGIRLSRNFGKEAALCAGLEAASGDGVIVMDSDLQHPPKLIPEMIRLWKEEGYEVIEGVKSDRGKEHPVNRIGAHLFYSLLTKLSGFDFEQASDFKLLDKKVVDAWKTLRERDTFFRGMSAWVGFKHTTLHFDIKSRTSGVSKWSFFKLFKLAINALTSFSSIPLQIVTVTGIIFLFSSIVLGIQTLYMKFMGKALSGFTTIILLLLIIGSTLMISLGIIGTYIARIYEEVKNRPRYIVSEEIKSNPK